MIVQVSVNEEDVTESKKSKEQSQSLHYFFFATKTKQLSLPFFRAYNMFLVVSERTSTTSLKELQKRTKFTVPSSYHPRWTKSRSLSRSKNAAYELAPSTGPVLESLPPLCQTCEPLEWYRACPFQKARTSMCIDSEQTEAPAMNGASFFDTINSCSVKDTFSVIWLWMLEGMRCTISVRMVVLKSVPFRLDHSIDFSRLYSTGSDSGKKNINQKIIQF